MSFINYFQTVVFFCRSEFQWYHQEAQSEVHPTSGKGKALASLYEADENNEVVLINFFAIIERDQERVC